MTLLKVNTMYSSFLSLDKAERIKNKSQLEDQVRSPRF